LNLSAWPAKGSSVREEDPEVEPRRWLLWFARRLHGVARYLEQRADTSRGKARRAGPGSPAADRRRRPTTGGPPAHWQRLVAQHAPELLEHRPPLLRVMREPARPQPQPQFPDALSTRPGPAASEQSPAGASKPGKPGLGRRGPNHSGVTPGAPQVSASDRCDRDGFGRTNAAIRPAIAALRLTSGRTPAAPPGKRVLGTSQPLLEGSARTLAQGRSRTPAVLESTPLVPLPANPRPTRGVGAGRWQERFSAPGESLLSPGPAEEKVSLSQVAADHDPASSIGGQGTPMPRELWPALPAGPTEDANHGTRGRERRNLEWLRKLDSEQRGEAWSG